MAAIYCADIYCDDCAEHIKNRICAELWRDNKNAITPDGIKVSEFATIDELSDYLDSMDERSYDSDEYPKYCDDDEESDVPQHCAAGEYCRNPYVDTDGAKYGHFFGNNLTTDGADYVRDTIHDHRRAGHTDSIACTLWASYYDYIDYDDEED